MPVKNSIARAQPEIAAWRQDIHAHPELGFEVHRTAGLVADKLRGFGCDEVTTGVGHTGVVGVIRGKSTASGRVIGLRADMDALPIAEATGAAHASTYPGKMHACGHDGHTAMLLGAAQYLAGTRNFDGTVVLIFQPAEEGAGGARAMIEDGLMARWGIQEVYGMHTRPGLPLGDFAVRAGPVMASADEFGITVYGKGGHAAEPHEGVDPTVIASQIILALQQVISREKDPIEQAVLSVASVETASHAYNVIPGQVLMRGTVRNHVPAAQDMIERRLGEVARGIAESLGGRAEVRYSRDVPITINSDEPAAFAADIAAQVAGHCHTAPLTMAAEDFSEMLNARPGAFIFIGNGDSVGVHHPAFDFNDGAIAAGCSWYAELIEQRLPAGGSPT